MADKRIRSCAIYGSNFILAVGIFVISTAWSGIFPFGERSFLTEDLMFQYVDFFTWFQHALSGSESLFYSTSQALGNNAWGLYSYYLGSPLNFLIAFFPDGAITEFVYFITAVKLGLIQACVVFFLRKRFNLSFAWCSALALGFVFSTWTVTQLRNPEWLDVLIFLPLAAWGVHELIEKKHWRLLVLSIAGSIICCWYTGYMLVVFMMLYFFFELWLSWCDERIGCDEDVERGKQRSLSQNESTRTDYLRCIGRFVASLCGALALSAFTFVPSVLAMMQKISPALDIMPSQSSLVSKVLNAFSSHKVFAVIACAIGVICLAVLLYIVFTRRLKPNAKYALVLIGALLVSAAVAVLAIVLHLSTCGPVSVVKGLLPGGWVLNLVPQLYAGLLILVLAVAFFVTPRIPLSLKTASALVLCFLVISVFFSPLYIAWCGFKAPNGFYCRITYLALFFMLWIAACCIAKRALPIDKVGARFVAVLPLFLLILVACDMLVSTHLAWTQLYLGYSQEFHEGYVEEAEAEQIELQSSDPGVYRIAKDYTRAGAAALNEGMARGYDEISSYSSAHNENAVAFLNDLGYSRVGEFSTRYAYPLLAMDSLLGVKYVYSTSDAEGFTLLESTLNTMGAALYENPYPLALGYAVSENAKDITFVDTDDPFERQNELINGFVGYDLGPYQACEAIEKSRTNTSITYEVHIPAGCLGYAYVLDAGSEPCYLQMDGRSLFTENFRFQDAVYGIAETSDDMQVVSITLTSSVDESSSESIELASDARCVFYGLNMMRFAQAYDELSQHQMSFDIFSGNHIIGSANIDAPQGDLLMISVPAEKGWSVRVNGVPVDVVDIAGGALTGIPVGHGANKIEMTFVSPGLLTGSVITCIALVLLTALSIQGRMKKGEGRHAKRG